MYSFWYTYKHGTWLLIPEPIWHGSYKARTGERHELEEGFTAAGLWIPAAFGCRIWRGDGCALRPRDDADHGGGAAFPDATTAKRNVTPTTSVFCFPGRR